MEKRILEIKIDCEISDCGDNGRYGIDMPIRAFINNLIEAEKKGAEKICIDAEEEFGGAYLAVKLTKERLETEEELQNRINDLKRRDDANRQKELDLLKKLKSKYEK